jgi:hypothetical protein
MQATMLVCDDTRLEITGKGILIGLYVTDMAIPVPSFQTAQLQFFLIFECTLDERPKSLTFEVTLPNQKPVTWFIPIVQDIKFPEGRDRLVLRQPFQLLNPVLEPGRINARIIHEGGEIELRGPWIVLVENLAPPILTVQPAQSVTAQADEKGTKA